MESMGQATSTEEYRHIDGKIFENSKTVSIGKKLH